MSEGTSRAHIQRAGDLTVRLDEATTLELFTPEGERLWIEGWTPRYPEGGRPPLAAGLVFETEKEGDTATWVVARYAPEEGRAAYAYVLPGKWATLVDVAVMPMDPSTSRVRVTYHMTALAPEADAAVQAFGERFSSLLPLWEETLQELQTSGTTRVV